MARILLLVLLVAMALPLWAVDMRHSRETLIIPKGQVVSDDLIVSGKALQMEGQVNGDLVVAAGTARIDGPVMGDLIIAGGNVVINQPVSGSVYVAGGMVDVSALVGRNMLVAGGTVNINQGASITRDLVLTGGHVTLAGTVGHNVRARARMLTLTGTAVIHGDLLAMTNHPTIMPGAVINGKQTITAMACWRHQRHGGVMRQCCRHICMGMALLLVGFIFLALFPQLATESTQEARAHLWGSLLTGFILLVVVPVAILIAVVTLLGIPLAVFALWLYLTMVYLSPIFVAILVGQRLLRRQLDGSKYLGLTIGIVLLILVRCIPVLGALVLFVITLIGLGALVNVLRARRVQCVK